MYVAQMLGRQVVTDQQEGFVGGVNTIGDALELQPNQMARADNVRLTTIGGATKRGGTQRVHASSLGGAVQAGFCWRKASSVEHLAVANGVFYTGGSSIAIPVTYTAKSMSGGGAALSSSAYLSIVAFRDGTQECVYVADGGTLLAKWDGTSLTRVAGTPAGIARLEVYNQRLHGITTVDQTDWWSAVNNGDTMGIDGVAGGSAVVRTFGNQRLTTLHTIVGTLALSHVTGVSRFTGTTQDDIDIAAGAQGFSSDVGSQFPNSWVTADGVGYFLSDRGAFQALDVGIAPLDTPQIPDPTVPVIAALGASNFGQVSGVHDSVHHEIRWFLPGFGIAAFNVRLRAWTLYPTGVYVSASTTVQWPAVNDAGDPIVLFGSADGFVRQADVTGSYVDDVHSDGTSGSNVSMVATCHRMFSQDDVSEKSFRFAFVFADLDNSTSAALSWESPTTGSGTQTFIAISSGETWGSFTWGSFNWGGNGATRYKVPISGRGSYIDLTVSDASPQAPIFSRLTLKAFDMGARA
jgi:hypothetical protein